MIHGIYLTIEQGKSNHGHAAFQSSFFKGWYFTRWSIVNVRLGVRLNDSFNLGAGAENLFDKVYQDHLGDYNGMRESDIAVGA